MVIHFTGKMFILRHAKIDEIIDLGTIAYAEAWEFQQKLFDKAIAQKNKGINNSNADSLRTSSRNNAGETRKFQQFAFTYGESS